MTDSEFDEYVDDTLIAIEEAVDACGGGMDYETSGGILTLLFDNGSKIIVNRQTPVKQLWVAAKSGGFHFDYDQDSGTWRRAGDGLELFKLLSQLCSEQAGKPVTL
jgi:CyaY protein